MPAISRSEPLGLSTIAEGHAVLGLELVERALVGEVAAFAVRDGHAQDLAALRASLVKGESTVSVRSRTSRQMNLQPAVADQRAGQQSGFHQDLEAVADAQHQPALGGELAHGAA